MGTSSPGIIFVFHLVDCSQAEGCAGKESADACKAQLNDVTQTFWWSVCVCWCREEGGCCECLANFEKDR